MWMIDHADALRAAAQERRNRGRHVGKSAAGWNVKRRDPAKGTWERTVAEAKARWSFVRGGALQQFQIDVHGDPLADFIPF